MNFQPLTDDQLELSKPGPWPDGEVNFHILGATEKRSKSGNPMIELELELEDADGRTKKCRDWLVLMESMMWKLAAFCKAIGNYDAYLNGEIDPFDLEGSAGRCMIITDDRGYNKVDGYLDETSRAKPATPALPADDDEDDDFPM